MVKKPKIWKNLEKSFKKTSLFGRKKNFQEEEKKMPEEKKKKMLSS